MITNDNIESFPEAVLPLWLDDIDGFLDQLRIEKFAIGIGGHTKVLVLLNHLQDQQMTICTWQQAHQWLAPILCSTPEQRDRLAQILSSREAQYALDHEIPMQAPQPAPVQSPASPVPGADAGRAAAAKQFSSWMVGLGFLVLLAIVGGAYYFWPESSNKLPDPSKVDTPIEAPTNNNQDGATGSDYSDNGSSGSGVSVLTEINFNLDISYIASILLALMIVAIAVFRVYELRQKTLKLARKMSEQRLNEESIPYRFEFTQLFSGGELSHPIQVLRKHIEVQSNQLDVTKTIQATIKSGGQVRVKQGTRPQLPEYLLLTQKNSSEDHHSALAQSLTERLQKEQVHIKSMEYFIDPRRCRDNQGHSINLADIQGGQIYQRLLILADAEDFFRPGTLNPHPWVELISRWQWAAVLTPKPYEEWGKRETQLVELGLHLHPVSYEGINNLAVQLQEDSAPAFIRPGNQQTKLWRFLARDPDMWLQSYIPDDEDIDRLLQLLEEDLPQQVFELLCSVAVLPTLSPNLTLGFLQELQQLQGLDPCDNKLEEVYTYLSRLPWFHEGYMPDWLRVRLIAQLPYQLEGRVRSICRSMIANKLAPEDANFFLKIAKEDESALGRLLHSVKRGSQQQDLHDYLFLGFMEGDKELTIDIGQQSELAKTARPGLNRQEWLTLLLGVVPAVIIVLFNPFSVLQDVWSSAFSAGIDVVRSLPIKLSYLVIIFLGFWVFAPNEPNKPLKRMVTGLAMTPLLYFLNLWAGVISLDTEPLDIQDGLVAMMVLGIFVLQPYRNKRSDLVVKVGMVPSEWKSVSIYLGIAVLPTIFYLIHRMNDEYSFLPTTTLTKVTTALVLGVCLWIVRRYFLRVVRGDSLTDSFRNFNTLGSIVVLFYMVFVCALYGFSDTEISQYLFVKSIAWVVAIVITATYLNRYLYQERHRNFVAALRKWLLPWLILQHGLGFLVGTFIFGNYLGLDQNNVIGVGSFLWLAIYFSDQSQNANNEEQLKPFRIWGGSLIIASLVALIVNRAVFQIELLDDIDFWSLVLFLPLARLVMPEYFLRRTKTIEKSTSGFMGWLPIFWLLPFVGFCLSIIEYLSDAVFIYNLCLVPFALWLANKYGNKAHWVFAPFYLFYLVLPLVFEMPVLDLMDSLSAIFGIDIASDLDYLPVQVGYLALLNFLIYLHQRIAFLGQLIRVTHISKMQWVFLLLVVPVFVGGWLGDFNYSWDGTPIFSALLLLASLTNTNFRFPIILASVLFVLNMNVSFIEISMKIDPNVWVRLFPGWFGEYLFFLVALVGFRWVCQMQGKGWRAMTVLMVLLPFQVLSISFSLTEILSFSLKNNFLLLLLSLLIGMRFTGTFMQFLIVLVALLVPACFIPSFMGEPAGYFRIGWVVSWQINYGEILLIFIACVLFFQLGRRCRFLIAERQRYITELNRRYRSEGSTAFDQSVKYQTRQSS